jgi:hypothetical protein
MEVLFRLRRSFGEGWKHEARDGSFGAPLVSMREDHFAQTAEGWLKEKVLQIADFEKAKKRSNGS